MEPNPQSRVEFSNGHTLAIFGLLAGVVIAVCVPAIVLGLGHGLTANMQMWLVVLGISFGGLTSLTAAFFGLVIPSSVCGSGEGCCGRRKSEEPAKEYA